MPYGGLVVQVVTVLIVFVFLTWLGDGLVKDFHDKTGVNTLDLSHSAVRRVQGNFGWQSM